MPVFVFASIDAGSNAIRLLVAESRGGRLRRLRRERVTTRLAGGGGLSPASVEQTIKALRGYRRIIARYGVHGLWAVGTSALRDARRESREGFLRRALEETGIFIEVISARREAELAAKGVTMFDPFDVKKPALILDIGGGSAEWTLVGEKGVINAGSLPVGVVKLAGMLAKGKDIEDETGGFAAGLKRALPRLPRGVALVMTGGTSTTIASIDMGLPRYRGDAVHGRWIPLSRAMDIYGALTGLAPGRLRRVKGLEPDRADLIIPGIGLTIKAMQGLHFDGFFASDTGLPEGVIIELAGSSCGLSL